MMRDSTPKYLRPGDCIALVAPAGKVKKSVVKKAIQTLEEWDLQVASGTHLFKNMGPYSGSDEQRLDDFQQALDDQEVRAIICARGGYGTVRIIDQMDFTRFVKRPKWIVGFSDITVLHAHIQKNYNIETIHSVMAAGIDDSDESSASLKEALFGAPLRYNIEPHVLNKKGKSHGILIGGNLAILTSLMGSVSEPDTRNKILFLEETGENLYRLDRMMWTLKRAEKLKHLSGLMIGSITDTPDKPKEFGKSALEIIKEHVKEYSYPVCMNFPAGHQKDNRALILGRQITLEIDSVTSLFFSSH